MEKFLYIFIHLGIPGLVFLALLLNRSRSKLGMIGTFVCCTAVLVFLYFWGQWPIAFTYYFKYLLVLLGLACARKFIVHWRRKTKWSPRGFWGYARTILAFVFGILVSLMAFQVFKGRSYGDLEHVSLTFPLKDGKYYVSLGGSNRMINNHFGTAAKAQWYALDFNKLSPLGSVSSPPWSNKNDSHIIFGEMIYAPCSGQLVELRSDVADNASSSMDVSAEDGMGNYISLNCDGTIVTMVHLKQNSVLVDEGDEVYEGQPLGQVGNSGFSQEPHLHFQAARYQADSTLMGMPIKFKGRSLVRNDIIKN